MTSDIPLAGQIYRELYKLLFKRNALVNGELKLADQQVDLHRITCPLLNIVAEADDVVHPRSSLGLLEHVGSEDKRNLVFPSGHIGSDRQVMAASRPMVSCARSVDSEFGRFCR